MIVRFRSSVPVRQAPWWMFAMMKVLQMRSRRWMRSIM
ncbi:hypothetical protein BURCENBC7_AP4238 [Burkholderia cenocepacia BC7]|nr:hypothetical protein BURCENK562V_C5158 [Burkholderia cenocepacia K56-2Valvano]ERI24723.1 hypothetical protein BURCENBC7_AP4238 [Burkholderia cenocepacia BC7]